MDITRVIKITENLRRVVLTKLSTGADKFLSICQGQHLRVALTIYLFNDLDF
jgi:hypothetical protein